MRDRLIKVRASSCKKSVLLNCTQSNKAGLLHAEVRNSANKVNGSNVLRHSLPKHDIIKNKIHKLRAEINK